MSALRLFFAVFFPGIALSIFEDIVFALRAQFLAAQLTVRAAKSQHIAQGLIIVISVLEHLGIDFIG